MYNYFKMALLSSSLVIMLLTQIVRPGFGLCKFQNGTVVNLDIYIEDHSNMMVLRLCIFYFLRNSSVSFSVYEGSLFNPSTHHC